MAFVHFLSLGLWALLAWISQELHSQIVSAVELNLMKTPLGNLIQQDHSAQQKEDTPKAPQVPQM